MPAKLVAIGDSLTQGFQSGSIAKTHLSYPALMARALGLQVGTQFRVPELAQPSQLIIRKVYGGLPVDIEDIARIWDSYTLPGSWVIRDAEVVAYLNAVKDYWEGDGGETPINSGPVHHNLAVWGFEVGDADTISEGLCHREIKRGANEAPLFTNYPMYRTARLTLNPTLAVGAPSAMTQVTAAKQIATSEEGIENLIFFLGANNCLGCITHLDQPVKFSVEGELYLFSHDRKATLWTPELFRTLYKRVSDQVFSIGANNVFVGTIPHMHIPPIARGTSLRSDDIVEDGIYEYYVPCYVSDEQFQSGASNYAAFFTRSDMQLVNSIIDQYNVVIKKIANDNTRDGQRWTVVETCQMLDDLHAQKYVFSQEMIAALKANRATTDRFDSQGKPIIRTDFFIYNQSGATPEEKFQGGFFGLDGIHPTTVGYGLVAEAFLKAMQQPAAVTQAWWQFVVDSDTLLTDPPKNMADMLHFAGQIGATNWFQRVADVLGRQTLGIHIPISSLTIRAKPRPVAISVGR